MLFLNFRSGCVFSLRGSRGASLIETLVTVAVTSVGLLGIAGLMAVTTGMNASASHRAQIEWAAQTLIDSVHINAEAVSSGGYGSNSTSNQFSVVDCLNVPCDSAALARFDMHRFQRAISVNAPNAVSELSCHRSHDETVLISADEWVCQIGVRWPRHMASSANAESDAMVWTFRP